jgi:hypothetical protein
MHTNRHTPELKSVIQNLITLLPFCTTLIFWILDGARLSFWATSIAVQEEVPVVEGMPELGTQTKVTWVDQFICGIETPAIGFLVTACLLFIRIYRKRSLKKITTSMV